MIKVTISAFLDDGSTYAEVFTFLRPAHTDSAQHITGDAALARYETCHDLMIDGSLELCGELDGEQQEDPASVIRVMMQSEPAEHRFSKEDRLLDGQQAYSLVSSVCEGIVSLTLQRFTPENADWTGMWEDLSSALASTINKEFTIRTTSEADETVHTIAEKAREEITRWFTISETDKNVAAAEGHDRWLERMEEDNWE